MLLRTLPSVGPAAVVIALLAAACAHAPARPPAAVPPRQFAWNYEPDGAPNLVLYFGQSGTDNVGLGFSCVAGSGAIGISEMQDLIHPMDVEWDTRLALRSGPVRRAYPARGIGSDFGDLVSAHTTLDDPLLKAFVTSGRIAVGRYEVNAETPEELTAIRSFFAACRPPG